MLVDIIAVAFSTCFSFFDGSRNSNLSTTSDFSVSFFGSLGKLGLVGATVGCFDRTSVIVVHFLPQVLAQQIVVTILPLRSGGETSQVN